MFKQLEQLQQEYELARKIGTRAGFFDYYFKKLKTARTQIEAFNEVNDKYFEIFGEYKYGGWSSFRNQIARYYKSK